MDTVSLQTPRPSELTSEGLRALGPGSPCDAEPIHLSGAIQPHGCLVAVDPETMRVGVVSANLSEHLGRSVTDALGSPFTSLVDDEEGARLVRLVTEHPGRQADPILVRLADRGWHEAITHRSGPWSVLELERVEWQPTLSTAFHDAYRAAMDPTLATNELTAMCTHYADQVRALTGFERVVVYQFDDDGHGAVISESRDEDSSLGSLVGLHYPAGDIPRQARALFITKRVRVIADASYEPVPLVAAAGGITARELDLTLSDLRSVSPWHLMYLRDMGVAATMSVSIVCGDRLWGMILCHHREPRTVRHTVRRVCETLAGAFALQLDVARTRAERGRDVVRGALIADVVSCLGEAEPLADTTRAAGGALLELITAEAVVVRIDGQTAVVGPGSATVDAERLVDLVLAGVPPQPQRDLMWTSTAPADQYIAASAGLPEPVDVLALRLPRDPTDSGVPGAPAVGAGSVGGGPAGVDVFGVDVFGVEANGPAPRRDGPSPAGGSSDDVIVWVRSPRFEVRTWAGPPPGTSAGHGAAGRASGGEARDSAHPPRVFDPHEELIRDALSRWTDQDTTAAADLGRALPAGLLRRTRRLMADHDRGFRAERAQSEQTRLRLERELHRKLRLESLGKLAGGVAHDFNNLLSVILGHAEFVEQEARTAAAESDDVRWTTIREDTEHITTATQRAAQLTRQLLAFARREVTQPQPLDLDQVLTDLTVLLQRTLGSHIALRIRLGGESTTVLGSPEQLERVLVNLAVNARDAMPDGGSLTITTDVVRFGADAVADGLVPAVGRWVRARVEDTGQGIPAHIIDQVFDPFFTTKVDGEGSGLGLATAHGILDQAGGRIDIWSEPGVGTVVTLLLPVTAQAVATPADPGPPARDGAGRTVLLVEDEPGIRNITTRVLRGAGYHVLAAADGFEALAHAESGDPIDILLTDVVMPGMLGKDVAAGVRSLRPEVAVLFMSGFAQSLATGVGTIEPGVALLDKPFTGRQLLARLADLGAAHPVRRAGAP